MPLCVKLKDRIVLIVAISHNVIDSDLQHILVSYLLLYVVVDRIN